MGNKGEGGQHKRHPRSHNSPSLASGTTRSRELRSAAGLAQSPGAEPPAPSSGSEPGLAPRQSRSGLTRRRRAPQSGPRRARRAGRGCGGAGAGARRPPSLRRLWSVLREPPEPRRCWDNPPRTDGGTEQRERGAQRAAAGGRGGGRFRREGTRSPSRGGTAAQAGRCRRGPPPPAVGRRAVTDLSAGAW